MVPVMPAAQFEYGSVEWFADARAKTYGQIFALLHIINASEAADRLLAEFGRIDEVIASALFRTVVVEYGKPFASSRNLKTYAFNSIKSVVGVERNIHEELLTMRNKLIAHQDEDFTDRVLLTACAVTETNGLTVSFPVAVQFQGLLLSGINNEEFLKRIVAHLKSCSMAIGERSHTELENFREAVSLNYANFVEFSKDARFRLQGAPIVSDGVTSPCANLNYPITLNTPELLNRSGYLYRLYNVNHTKNGIVTAKDDSTLR